MNPAHDLWQDRQEVWQNGTYLTELITEKAVQFIERNADTPFFLYVPYNAPHYPMHAPQKYMDRFAHLPWDRQVMAAMISAVDDGVGEIVEALKRIGRFDDTVIFFSSDNGPSTESRNWLDGTEDKYYGGSAGIFRGHKFSLYEGGIREPAILSYPSRFPGGRVCDEVGAMMDIWPTFIELAGSAALPEDGIDGSSIVAMAAGEAGSPHSEVFWEHGKQLAVRRGRWKLVLNGREDVMNKGKSAAETVHLSDLSVDPGEKVNLAAEHPDLVLQLRADAESWYAGLTQGK